MRLAEQREARFQRSSAQREEQAARRETASRAGQSGARVRAGVRAPSRAATAVTQRSGAYSGKGVLTAELLAGFVIVAIRVVADYEVQEDGTATGKVLHKDGQYGPLPILAGLIATFFALSFVAIGGGTRAKVAVLLGGAVVLTLGVRSLNEIKTAGTTFGNIGTITVPAAAGSEGSGASGTSTSTSTSTGSGSGSTGAAPSSNAFGAFQRLEGSPVTGVPSAVAHAVGGTWDLAVAAADAVANAGSAPASSNVLSGVVAGAEKIWDDFKSLF